MSRRLIRGFIAAALLAGVLAGVIAALAVPTHSRVTAPPPRISVLPPLKPKPDSGLVVLQVQKGSARIELTAPDPRGGPPFAIRAFRAVMRAPSPVHGPPRPGRLLGHDLCAQLGRIYRGRFGWIDAGNRFRPARFSYVGAPIECGERWRDKRNDPELTRTTLITNPLLANAQPTESVVWGIAGSLLRGVSLQVDGVSTQPVKISKRGAFLAFADPSGPSKVTGNFGYAGRPPKTLTLDPARPLPVSPPLNRYEHGIVLDSEQLEARAPDPTGELPWGIEASRSTKGGYCPWDIGRVVGSRVGRIDYSLDTFTDSGVLPCLSKIGFTRKMPVQWNMTEGASDPDLEVGSDPDLGRVALRTLPGRTVMSGLVSPDVREITIQTPRDVRTIVPSPRAHAFIVVYDGSFPAGNTDLRVTFSDGSHTVQHLGNLGF
ncbi:MAG TPA: hypothetical protein VGI67_13550 [Thermoleophilaceae bacterium]